MNTNVVHIYTYCNILYSVLVGGKFVRMMVNSSHGVQEILIFLHLTKEELKLKEELPWS